MALYHETTAVLIVGIEPVLPFWSELGITPAGNIVIFSEHGES